MTEITVLESNPRCNSEVRFRLRLPVIFHWNEEQERVGGGFTSDISRNTAFVMSKRCPPAGSEVRIEVLLPSPGRPEMPLMLEGMGKVRSVFHEVGYTAFAFEGEFCAEPHWPSQVEEPSMSPTRESTMWNQG